MRILITGGNGVLGKNIIPLLEKEHEVIAPFHSEKHYFVMDVKNENHVNYFLTHQDYSPNLVIHCAAAHGQAYGEKNPKEVIETNVLGSLNLTLGCMSRNIRLVYISTSHVFDGETGNYKSSDPINPISKYAKSKAAAELVTRIYDNSLSIRTDFFDINFPFEHAYEDKWSSKEYIDILAPRIVEKCLSDETGVCHVSGKRSTFYDMAIKRNPNVKKGKRDHNHLKDTSLI
tara:strand:+ start:993 stop:1685 length:693 start_codon:yes stop_codon:yes gene_type:complete